VNAAAGEEEAETLRSLNAKLNAGYENWHAQLSPRTRAAWAEYKRLEALDREEGYLCYDDPEHELYQDPEAQWDEVEEAMPFRSQKRGRGRRRRSRSKTTALGFVLSRMMRGIRDIADLRRSRVESEARPGA